MYRRRVADASRRGSRGRRPRVESSPTGGWDIVAKKTESRSCSCVATKRLRRSTCWGIPAEKVTNCGFPDGGLNAYQGRRPPLPGKQDLCGYVGLQNWLTYALRQYRPARVFVPTPTDLHPDHRITYNELMISLFHATGAIWPELGPPMIEVPSVYEMAVYCDFAELPNLEVIADEPHLQKKLDSIAAFQSQLQIGELVNNVKQAGAYEYFREVQFRLYSAENYKSLFADSRT